MSVFGHTFQSFQHHFSRDRCHATLDSDLIFVYQPIARSKAAHSVGWGFPNRQIITDLSRVSSLQCLCRRCSTTGCDRLATSGCCRGPCWRHVGPHGMTSASIEPCELRGFSWQAQSVPALRDLDNVHNSTLQPCHTYRFRWIGAGPCLWLLVIPVDDFKRSHQW